MSKTTIKMSKEHLDIEVRNIVRKMSHRPRSEIIQIVREQTNSVIDNDYLDNLLAKQR